MQFPQTACDAAQGDDSVWSHEPDCIDTAPDERLASTLQRLGQKNATQRDLHRLERRPRANLIQFSKTKCKVLPLGQGNPQDPTDGVMDELRRTCGYKTKIRCGLAMCAHITESQTHPSLHKNQHGQQVGEVILPL